MKHLLNLLLVAFMLTCPMRGSAQDKLKTISIQVKGALTSADVDHNLRLAIGLGDPTVDSEIIERTQKIRLEQQAPLLAESVSQSIQNGGTPLSSAATSLVSKSLSSILGIAEESGAISSTTSGSTTTLTANLQQIVNYLGPTENRCYLISPRCSVKSQFLRGGTLAVSLNSSAQTGTPSLTTTSSAALAALSGVNNPTFSSLAFKENFHGRRRPIIDSDQFKKAIKTIDPTTSTALLAAYTTLIAPLTSSASTQPKLQNEYVAALTECTNNLKPAGDNETILHCLDSFAEIAAQVPGIDGFIKDFIQAEVAYDTSRDAALQSVFFNSTYSFEYDLTNNANQPMTSTFKGIYGYQYPFRGGVLETTANGSATIYNSLRGSSDSRLRSAQGALQLDLKPDSQRKIQPELSAGYYFQYMVSNGLLDLPSTAFAPGTAIPLPSNASELLNTTGPIHIGQGKLTLSIKGTNIKIPLAITGASRTDLVKANKVSGNFGISYDFSSLLLNQ